jgi:hypothetical protein
MGKPKLALPLLEQAVAVAAAENHDVIDLARMRLLLARCLTNHGEEGVRRRLLASAARDVYGRNPRFAKESAEVDAWLGTSPPER